LAMFASSLVGPEKTCTTAMKSIRYETKVSRSYHYTSFSERWEVKRRTKRESERERKRGNKRQRNDELNYKHTGG
jgi:hypothetical protein